MNVFVITVCCEIMAICNDLPAAARWINGRTNIKYLEVIEHFDKSSANMKCEDFTVLKLPITF